MICPNTPIPTGSMHIIFTGTLTIWTLLPWRMWKVFKTYYSPNNAALVVVGDFETASAKEWIDTYFKDIPSVELPPKPDISEPRQEKEKDFIKNDSLANKPAIAIAYHMPDRNSPEYYAMGLLDQILIQGDNSLLQQKLVDALGYTSEVSGGINYLGNMFNYNGPMQIMFNLTYDKETSKEQVLDAVDAVMVKLRGGYPKMLDNAMVKMRSQLYDDLGAPLALVVQICWLPSRSLITIHPG